MIAGLNINFSPPCGSVVLVPENRQVSSACESSLSYSHLSETAVNVRSAISRLIITSKSLYLDVYLVGLGVGHPGVHLGPCRRLGLGPGLAGCPDPDGPDNSDAILQGVFIYFM